MRAINPETSDVLRRLEELGGELTDRYTVTRIGVFGSFAQGNQDREVTSISWWKSKNRLLTIIWI